MQAHGRRQGLGLFLFRLLTRPRLGPHLQLLLHPQSSRWCIHPHQKSPVHLPGQPHGRELKFHNMRSQQRPSV